MIAGQHWSAATKSDKIALLRTPLSSAIMRCLCIPAEREAPRRLRGDGEQEVGGLRRIGTITGELGRAVSRDEAGVAVLPSVELAVEEGTALPVIRQGRQVGIDARDESTCALVGAVGFRRPRLVLVFRRHLVPDSHSAGCERWLHYVADFLSTTFCSNSELSSAAAGNAVDPRRPFDRDVGDRLLGGGMQRVEALGTAALHLFDQNAAVGEADDAELPDQVRRHRTTHLVVKDVPAIEVGA